MRDHWPCGHLFNQHSLVEQGSDWGLGLEGWGGPQRLKGTEREHSRSLLVEQRLACWSPFSTLKHHPCLHHFTQDQDSELQHFFSCQVCFFREEGEGLQEPEFSKGGESSAQGSWCLNRPVTLLSEVPFDSPGWPECPFLHTQLCAPLLLQYNMMAAGQSFCELLEHQPCLIHPVFPSPWHRAWLSLGALLKIVEG